MRDIESESLLLLKQIVEGPVEAVGPAVDRARKYLTDLRSGICLHRSAGGRPCKTTPEQLREISRLAAEGLTDGKIELLVGVHRRTVRHHLQPSGAMLRALLGEQGGEATPSGQSALARAEE